MEEKQDLFEFKVDNMMAQELNETSRWTRLFSILVFIICALVLLVLLVSGSNIAEAFSAEMGSGNGQAIFITVLAVVVLVMVVVGIMMFILLRAANRIREGIRQKNQDMFNRGLSDMKTYFAIFGVISILGLFFNLLSIF